MKFLRDLFTWGVLLLVLYVFVSNVSTLERAATSLTLPALAVKQTGHAAPVLERLNQLDPAQYDSPQEYDIWSGSTCSAAAIAAVLNFYGLHERVHEVLQVEIEDGDITPEAGLLSHAAIARTAAHYRFQTILDESDTLDHVLALANAGHPVIVNWPPGRFYSGHFVVVTGGNGKSVDLADSSSYHYRRLPRAQFLAYWAGFSAVLTPP